MAQPHSPPQASLTSPLDALQLQEPTQLPDLSLFGPGQYPESVAFWHTSPNQPLQPILPAPSASDASISPTQQPASQPIPDQKKHKRTRSGCFTCRSRRIKCDEARPICDRCRKGNRDCTYPSTGSSSKASPRSSAKPRGHHPPSQGSDSSGLVEQDDFRALEPIVDEDEEEAESMGSGTRLSPATGTGLARSSQKIPRRYSTQSLKKGRTRQSEAEVAGSRKESSSSPSTETSSKFESMSVRSASVSLEPFALPNIAHLPEDLRFYVAFHQDFLTYHHYFLHLASDRFIHQTIIDFALQYDPLLYAIVGFSAYHHCVHTRTGKLYNFLKYYDTALKLLRKSLASGEPHWEATLITVLMLTTFEEFVGDWVNLIDHHQAAHALMRELLTPESVNTNELHSHIFLWYSRFDVVAGLLGGNETILAREWYISKEEYDAEQAASNPSDPQKQLALTASINRRFGLDMASLYAKLSRGMIPYEEFIVQNELLGQTLERTKRILDTFNDSEYRVLSYPHSRPLTEDDVVDPYVPGGLHHGPLWEVNYAWIDYISTKLMYKYQSLLSTQQSSMIELGSMAVELCRLTESVERWPEKENGYVFAFKNSMAMASMFLPMHPKYIMWSRGKFALLEQNGYITPPKFRAGLAALWRLPEINEWWLPNGEGYPKIIREVRTMTEEGINNPRDNFRESVRDMKTLFWKINLDDTESENSPSPAGPTP